VKEIKGIEETKEKKKSLIKEIKDIEEQKTKK